MGMKEELYKRIKEEITNDPEGRGYAGKTASEIMNLLNQPFQQQETLTHTRTARIHNVILGLADAPNAITDVNDIVEAQKVILGG